MTAAPRDRFRHAIAEMLGVPDDAVTLFARGRVALYAVLRGLDIGPGDEVLVPAFTCVAVPNAILYTGARPVWVDIDEQTLTLDPAALEAAITARSRVIVAQNTFGLSADLDAIMTIAARHDLSVVDDCTHGLGGRYRAKPNGVTAPLSFFSTQWSKPISTGLGGFAVALDPTAAGRLREIEAAAAEPSAARSGALHLLHVGHGRLLRYGRAAYRTLSRVGAVPGSSSRDELEGSAMPKGFLARLSDRQASLGLQGLAGLEADVQRRRSIAHEYSDWLLAKGRTPACEPSGSEHIPQVPIARNRPRHVPSGGGPSRDRPW
jgi:perosamine synthetase